jgi:hypothetical protein
MNGKIRWRSSRRERINGLYVFGDTNGTRKGDRQAPAEHGIPLVARGLTTKGPFGATRTSAPPVSSCRSRTIRFVPVKRFCAAG